MSYLFKLIKNSLNHSNNNDIENECKSSDNNLNSSKKNIDDNKNNNITDTFNYSPEISFSHLPSLYKNDNFNNMWNGLKLSLNFKPTGFLNLEYMLNVEKNKKLFNNYSLHSSTYVPLYSILFPINLILIGHKESSQASSFQSHLFLGEKDKITIISNNLPKYLNNNFDIEHNLFLMNNKDQELENVLENDINNAELNESKNKNELDNNYSMEYCHEFNRGNVGIKLTNLEPNTLNFQISLYKNLFFGMEFFRNPYMEKKYHFLKANYGLMLKQTPQNKFGLTFNYISTLPASIINCCYQINNNFKLYLNTVFNRNELLIKLGQGKFNGSISGYYKNDFIEVNTELNNKGEFKFLSSFSFNKYIDVLTNFSYDHMKKNKKKFKCFGFGLNLKNASVEEKIEELVKKQKIDYMENNKFYNDYKNIMKLK
mgnify:CR=1 FL=1